MHSIVVWVLGVSAEVERPRTAFKSLQVRALSYKCVHILHAQIAC